MSSVGKSVCVCAARPNLRNLSPKVGSVHVCCHPPTRVLLTEILEKAPNLRRLLISSDMGRAKLRSPKFWLPCSQKNVVVRFGRHYHDPERRRRSSRILRLRDFKRRILLKQKEEFQFLLACEFVEAKLAKQYFFSDGSNGKRRPSLRKVAKDMGMKYPDIASLYLSALLHYLDPSFPTGETAKARARRIARMATRIRAQESPFATVRLSAPVRDLLEKVRPLLLEGRLEEFGALHPRHYRILQLRCGIEGPARSLEYIKNEFGMAKRQAVLEQFKSAIRILRAEALL